MVVDGRSHIQALPTVDDGRGSDVRARLSFREPVLAKFQAQALSLRQPGIGLGLDLSRGFGVVFLLAVVLAFPGL